MSALNEGWYFEGPDPSVGIFGDVVVHEDCPQWSDDEPLVPTEDVTIRDDGPHLVAVVTTYTCPCGATTKVSQQEPRDHFEEPRYDHDD